MIDEAVSKREALKRVNLPPHRQKKHVKEGEKYRIYKFKLARKGEEPFIFKTLAQSAEEAIENIEATFNIPTYEFKVIKPISVSKEDYPRFLNWED